MAVESSRRVLVLSQFFPPEPYAGAKRMAAMAGALATRHHVTVATLEPGYPSAADYAHLPVADLDRECRFEIKRRGRLEPHRASDAHRAAAELRMATRLAGRALGERCDVVLTSSPSMFLGPAGLALARLGGRASSGTCGTSPGTSPPRRGRAPGCLGRRSPRFAG